MNPELTAETPRSTTSVKMIVGLFFVIFGILLTAGNLDVIDPDRYLRLWPIMVVAVGLAKIVEPGGGLSGGTLVVVGSSLLAYNLEWVHFTIFDLWPLVLIGIGIVMVGRAAGLLTEGPRVPRNIAIFSAQEVNETSRDYRGTNVAAVFGSYELDLTGAEIGSTPAVVGVFAMWGGIEIIVPDHWEVVSEVTPVMAGVEVKVNRISTDVTRKLIIRGFTIMGGVEVKSKARRTA